MKVKKKASEWRCLIFKEGEEDGNDRNTMTAGSQEWDKEADKWNEQVHYWRRNKEKLQADEMQTSQEQRHVRLRSTETLESSKGWAWVDI